MILSREQILCYFIFILCISLITYYYINLNNKINKKNKNIQNNLYEKFTDSVGSDYFTDFTDTEITNRILKNAINQHLSSLKPTINKYAVLDPAININNNNILCDNSASSPSNNCKIENSAISNEPSCLSDRLRVSCSNFFDDYVIEHANIDLSLLKTKDNIIVKTTQLLNNIENKSREIDVILDKYIANIKSYILLPKPALFLMYMCLI